MATFIDMGERFINLDMVREARTIWNEQTGATKTVFIFNDDHHETCGGNYEAEIRNATASLVPASPGYELISFHFHREADPCGTEVRSSFGRNPIVAWRMPANDDSGGCPEPVCIDEVVVRYGNDRRTAILCPNGSVIDPANEDWPDLDAWITSVCQAWHKWFTEKQKTEAA
jgi:hypothetical protein